MDGILITARLKSTRLPGKALIDVNGKPLLSYLVNRIRKNIKIPIYICTSINPKDDPLQDFSDEMGCECYRGSEEDVLERYLSCCNKYGLERIYIVYADEPFIDIELLRKTFSQMDPKKKVWVRNDEYIDGVFGYGFTHRALNLVNKTKTSNENEVWGGMVSNMPITIISNKPPYAVNKNKIRLTVDYPEDLVAIKKILNSIAVSYENIDISTLCEVYEKLKLSDVNGFRSTGYQKRLKEQAV
jgi:spore coat polysaccharide biosynthesis protein SpsF